MNTPGTVPSINIMVKCPPLTQRHPDQRPFCRFGSLPDRLWNLAGFAVAKANSALLIPNHDKRGEAKTPATFDHLCNTVDVDQLVDKLAIARVSVSVSCHSSVPIAFVLAPLASR